MGRRLLSAFCTAGALLLAAPALAQAPLTLSQAIDEAIAHNPSLAAARASTRQAQAETRAVRAEWLPRLNFSEGWQRSTQPVAGFGTLLNARRFTAADFAVDRLNRPGAVDGFSRRLGVSQVIFDGNHTRAAVSLASDRASTADARATAAMANLALSVTQAYGRLAAAQAGADAARAAVAWAQEDLARATSRRDAGTATDADVLAMSVHAADMRQRQLQADSDMITARAALNQMMGAPVDRAFAIQLPAIAAQAPELAALVAEARKTRPELREADLAVTMAETGVRDARGGWLPTVAAGAGYEWNGLTFATRESAWTVGAELRWSLSAGGAEAARVSAAHAGVDAARASRAAAASAIELDVLTARQQWLVARARIDVGRLTVDDAKESLRITRQRYAAGLATVRDVLAATSAELAAEAQRTANDVDAVTAWAALQRAIGRGTFTDIQ
jgi:outer membrane protein